MSFHSVFDTEFDTEIIYNETVEIKNCIKELYRYDFKLDITHQNILLNKINKYTNTFIIPIQQDIWTYLIDNTSYQDFITYCNEDDIEPQLQLPITFFGKTMYNLIYDFVLGKLRYQIYNDVYSLNGLSKDKAYNLLLSKIKNKNISLKYLTQFVYQNLNSSNKIKQTIFDFFKETKCIYKDDRCKCIKNACILGHLACIHEYVNCGSIITNVDVNAALISNTLKAIVSMRNLGMPYLTTNLSLCINFECLDSIHYMCNDSSLPLENYNNIFFYWFSKHRRIQSYLKSLNYILTILPDTFVKIKHNLTKEWLINTKIDKELYSNLYTFQQDCIHNYTTNLERKQNTNYLDTTVVNSICKHLEQLFTTKNYYKLF